MVFLQILERDKCLWPTSVDFCFLQTTESLSGFAHEDIHVENYFWTTGVFNCRMIDHVWKELYGNLKWLPSGSYLIKIKSSIDIGPIFSVWMLNHLHVINTHSPGHYPERSILAVSFTDPASPTPKAWVIFLSCLLVIDFF